MMEYLNSGTTNAERLIEINRLMEQIEKPIAEREKFIRFMLIIKLFYEIMKSLNARVSGQQETIDMLKKKLGDS